MTSEALATWLLGIMVSTSPPGRARPAEAAETQDEGRARYSEIAKTMADVVLDPQEAPIFGGRFGRERTAALILSISYFESGWRRDVDLGLGGFARGDSGRSWCLMQIHVGKGTTAEGWSGTDLVGSHERCIRGGLHIIRRSVTACRARPVAEWLNAYASGTCDHGEAESKLRVDTAVRWFKLHPPPRDPEPLAAR